MGSAPFHLPREKYGSPKGTSVFTLNQSLFFFSKIGLCFFENRSLFFWSELGFFENRRSFFLKIGVCFLKIGVCFLKIGVYFFENRGLIFGNWSLSFLKIGVCSEKNRSLFFENPSIGPRVCAVILLWSSNKISGRSRGGVGESGPPLSLDQTEAQKNFLETAPPPPPFPLSEGLYTSFSIKTKSDFQKTNFDFNWNKLRLSINIDVP